MKTVKGGMETELRCPDCGEPLLIRFGKAGAFLACKAYPTCKYSSNFVRDEHGHLSIAPVQQIVVGICPQCGSDLVLKRSRTGSRFIACSGYPECHYAAPFSTHVKCPKCGKGEIVEKSSKKGRIFYSCSTYPACDFSTWNEPVARECPECKSPYLVVRTTKQGTVLACPNRECGYTCSPSDEDE